MTNESPEDARKPTIIDLDPAHVIDQDEVAKPKISLAQRRGFTKPLLGVAALAVAAVGGGWLYRDVLSTYFPSDNITALMQRADDLAKNNEAMQNQMQGLETLTSQLKSDVGALESNLNGTATEVKSTQEKLSGTATRLDQIEGGLNDSKVAVADLTQRFSTQATPSGGSVDGAGLAAVQLRLDALEKVVASLEASDGQAATDTAQLSQSLADLKAKLAAGAGFADELQRLNQLVPAAAGLDVLAPYSADGIADAKGLAAELTALMPQLPGPDIVASETKDESWWGQAIDMLSTIVTIRVAGAEDWQKAAAGAAALAESGDLPQAIESLNDIAEAKPAGVQQWLERAQARLKIEAAVKSVEEAVLRVIAAKG